VGSESKDKSPTDLLVARVSVLEQQVEFLLRLNGLNVSRFRSASDDELLNVYRDTVQLLGLSDRRFELETIEQWSDIFLQISEIEVVRLQPIVEVVHTWEPFYLMCLHMMGQVRVHPKMDSSIRTQQLYAALDKGLRGLRAVGVLTLKKNPHDLPAKANVLIDPDNLRKYLPY